MCELESTNQSTVQYRCVMLDSFKINTIIVALMIGEWCDWCHGCS